MSDKRRKAKQAQQQETETGPSKLEKEIATYVYNKCPKKQTLFMSEKVNYFIGSKAVDTLMESKWAKGTKKEDPIFADRFACTEYLSRLMELGMFLRAEKVVVKKVDAKKEKKSDKKASEKEEKKGEKLKSKDKKEAEKAASDAKSESSEEEEPSSAKLSDKDREKKKKKIRLEQTQHQVFLDSSDAYVWIFEPTSIRNMVLGFGLLIGAVVVCLFPLWPPIVRQGVYYLSLVMVGLIGLLIATALFRYVVFAIVWSATGGNTHFWYLPNLTEDCGFFESFVPAYTSSTRKEREEKAKEKASKKGKKSKKDKEEEAEKGEEKIASPPDEPPPLMDPLSEPTIEPEIEKKSQDSEDDFEVIARSSTDGSEGPR